MWLSAIIPLLILLSMPRAVIAQETLPLWYEVDTAGEVQIHLYFFWSESCPHCQAAHPFVRELAVTYPWLQIHDSELTTDQAHVDQYVQLASALGQQAQYVPAFIYCGTMMTGYDSAETTGVQIRDNLEKCYGQVKAYVQSQSVTATAANKVATRETAPAETQIEPVPLASQAEIAAVSMPVASAAEAARVAVPFWGEVAVAQLSLPIMTVILAALDGVNPCAFFVLMFLLSLLVHAGSRRRMFMVGLLFVFCSGFVYFLFMTAWLNLFLVIGALRWITIIAGLVAIVLAMINIKDFFWFNTGPTLSIPVRAKPRLYQRARALLQAERTAPLLLGTLLLAIAANSYELLCTTGFPLIYTRLLTLAELPTTAYYLYLGLYNTIYVVPLLLIVTFFVIKFGSRKLSEREGRALKLLSGLMMFMLGLLLVAAPEVLGQVHVAIGLLVAALLITAVALIIERRQTPAQP